MKKAIVILGLGLPLALLLAVGIGYLAIDENYDVSSKTTISADMAKVHPLVNNLENWQQWTVWTKEKYPGMESQYEGAAGKGAKWTWSDTNDENNTGWMKITDSDSARGIDYTLQFGEFPESNGHVHYKDLGDGQIEVTMGLKGSMPGMWKLFLPLAKSGMEQEFANNLERLKKKIEG